MKSITNIFACLVHEQQECIVDLVRNLHYLDPSSKILLYNGGDDKDLLKGFPFEKYGAVAVPGSQPLQWGWLHDFALDCMRYALDHFSFDILTIVDSDQLGIGQNYSQFMAPFLDQDTKIGMFGCTEERQQADTTVDPAITAYQEKALWQPLMESFPGGEEKFLYWTFWPSTVFTREAAKDLTTLFETNGLLQDILKRTKIWASEEIILPTLVSLLGYNVVRNPCSYDYVKYKEHYSVSDTDAAVARPDAFWMHPVPRQANNELRTTIAAHFENYLKKPQAAEVHPDVNCAVKETDRFISCLTIIKESQPIEGWLDDNEAELLIHAAYEALRKKSSSDVIVEVGSYCGKATVLLGHVVKHLNRGLVYAVDSFDGKVGALDTLIQNKPPSFAVFMDNINRAGLNRLIQPLVNRSRQLEAWHTPIGFLLIDGLHDYTNTARDFYFFEKWVDGYIAFHDYADYFPGVKTFVDELLHCGGYKQVGRVKSLIILEKIPGTYQETTIAPDAKVSCIMPTADRREFVGSAIACYLRQDYQNKELIIIDDGTDKIADLVPRQGQIKYISLDQKLTVGEKRNIACSEADGEIIIHWDDDDWTAPGWITQQCAHLMREKADITGLDRPYFYNPDQQKAWQYIYPENEKNWVHGGTLCYTKSFWLKNPFPKLNIAEDLAFIWSTDTKRISPHRHVELYVARIHEKNVSPKYTGDSRWHATDLQKIRHIMNTDF